MNAVGGLSDRERLEQKIRIVLTGSRRDMEVTQTELAKRAGWTRNSVANIESGRRSVGLVDFLMIAKALNIDPVALLHRVLRW